MIEQDEAVGGYRVERMLGRGGMGIVYVAVQSSLDRPVALKVLRPELAQDPAFVERFRREGRMQAAIEHPHVLDVYEVGEVPSHGLFLAMRLVVGPTLAELMDSGGLDVDRALSLLDQVGSALDAAHAAGLLHRDVKPQNILVDGVDHAFLADFGLSRVGTDPATSSRPMLGTVAYVAPEVIRGDAPGPASDRYAFAATLYHCLTGDAVFPRGSDASVLYAHAEEPPPPISRRRADLPASLDSIFEQALAKDPARRPASARAMVASVRDALGEAAVASLGAPNRAGLNVPTPETLPSVSGGTSERNPPPAGRPRLGLIPIVTVVALLAAGLGAGAVALLQGGDEPVADEVVPALVDGAEALGSDLGPPDDSVSCRGSEPAERSTSCAIVQTELPNAQLLVPADGTIVGWSVRGASGEVALDVIRPGGDDTTRIARSQWESAGNAAPFRFPANMSVERGDLIGIELGPGSSVGVRGTDGATTQRWFEPKGGAFGAPDRDAGTGFDYEMLLRADFVPGAEQAVPKSITGAEAARASGGRVRKQAEVEISKPTATVTVKLVEVAGRVALDLISDGRRMERVFVPGLLPGGQPIDLATYTYEGEGFSEVDVFWVNPNSGRLIYHFFNVSQRELQFVG